MNSGPYDLKAHPLPSELPPFGILPYYLPLNLESNNVEYHFFGIVIASPNIQLYLMLYILGFYTFIGWCWWQWQTESLQIGCLHLVNGSVPGLTKL